jgi:hypothetical protein
MIRKKLENHETKILDLYKQEKISKSTLKLIHHQIEKIRETLNNITEKAYGKDIILELLSRRLAILNDLIKAITNKNMHDIRALTQEMLDIITEGHSIDLFLAESSIPQPSLENYHYKEDNELTFFLLYPRSAYLTTDRVGLIAHETSHIHEIIEKYTESIKSEKRKMGESLADVLGLYVAGPLFAYSLSFVITNDFGTNCVSKIYDLHPSWIARVTVLRYVNSTLWETAIFKTVILELLDNIFYCGTPQSSEDSLIAKCMRAYDNHIVEFSKFKIDEKRIVRLKNGESDSLLYRLNAQYLR